MDNMLSLEFSSKNFLTQWVKESTRSENTLDLCSQHRMTSMKMLVSAKRTETLTITILFSKFQNSTQIVVALEHWFSKRELLSLAYGSHKYMEAHRIRSKMNSCRSSRPSWRKEYETEMTELRNRERHEEDLQNQWLAESLKGQYWVYYYLLLMPMIEMIEWCPEFQSSPMTLNCFDVTSGSSVQKLQEDVHRLRG